MTRDAAPAGVREVITGPNERLWHEWNVIASWRYLIEGSHVTAWIPPCAATWRLWIPAWTGTDRDHWALARGEPIPVWEDFAEASPVTAWLFS